MTRSPAFPPVARSRLPGQLIWRFQRDRLGVIESLAREHGDLVQLPALGREIFVISDPELIRQVLEVGQGRFTKGRGLENAALLLGKGLLTSEAPLHARQRRLMQPAFHRQQIQRYGGQMVALAEAHVAAWRDGETLDMAAEMMHLTRAIVARTLFDWSPQDSDDAVDAALSELVGSFGAPGAMLVPLWVVERGWLPGTRGLAGARASLDALVYRMIAERRANPDGREDLLSLLVRARDDQAGDQGMGDEQLRDEVMTLFLAGHETTANALAWTLYLLSEHPESLARLVAELDRVLAGRAPTAEDLGDLVYTRQALTEAMRLYPPAWVVGRRASVDVELGGYGIPRGATLLMSQWVVHRDPRWYETPDRFRPERWAAEAAVDRPKYAYFPFGGGPRRCIGEAFAWMEGTLLLATILGRWRPRLVPGHPVEPEPLITLRPRYGIRMRLEARRPAAEQRSAATRPAPAIAERMLEGGP